MQKRILGKNGLEVSALGYGCIGLDFAYAHLEKTLGAVDVALTDADLAQIQSAAAAIQIEGERYPEQLIKTTGL